MLSSADYDFRVAISSTSVQQLQRVGVEAALHSRRPFVTTYTGHIVLNSTSEIRVATIKVRIQGVALDSTLGRPGGFGRRREMYTIDQCVWSSSKEPSNGQPMVLGVGEHRWPIHFVLPDGQGSTGKIQHFVTAFLFHETSRETMTAISEFRHIDPVDLIDCDLPDPVFKEVDVIARSKWSRKKDGLVVKISLPQTGYLPGDVVRIPMILLSSGRSSRIPEMVAHVQLLQYVAFHPKPTRRNSVGQKGGTEQHTLLAQSFPMAASSISSGQHDGSVYPGAEHRELNIHIPRNTPSSILEHPEWIHVHYKLRVVLDIANAAAEDVKLPSASEQQASLGAPDISNQSESADGVINIAATTRLPLLVATPGASIRQIFKFPIVVGTRRGVMINGRMSVSSRHVASPKSSSTGLASSTNGSASDTGSMKERFRRSKFGSLVLGRSWSMRSRASTMDSRSARS